MSVKCVAVLTGVALLSVAEASAQPVSIGIRGGVPLTDFLKAAGSGNASYITTTKRYTIGPTVEFRFPEWFGVEVDALYKRFGYGFQDGQAGVRTGTRASSWEFPILGKLEMAPGPMRPFVDAGVSVRHITGIRQVRQVITAATFNQVELSNPPEFNKETDVGFAFGGGIAFKFGHVRISPEVRYTRWGGENLRDPIRALLRTNRNQADFLLGLTF